MQHDDAKAQGVIDDDDRDRRACTSKIDSEILSVLALQSPVAADLRLISAIMHSNLHLERVGDQAVNVAKLYLRTKDESGSQSMVMQLEEMGTIVVTMLRTAMEAFGRRDLELALEGARRWTIPSTGSTDRPTSRRSSSPTTLGASTGVCT